MAVIGINSVNVTQKKDMMDKIAQGLNIANSVLGVSLAVPEYLQKKNASDLDTAKSKAEILSNTTAPVAGDPNTIDVPGMGPRTVLPNVERQLQQQKLADTQPASPEDIQTAIKTPGMTFQPEQLVGYSKGELGALVKSVTTDAARNKENQKNNLLASSQPVTPETSKQKGWSQRTYPEFGLTEARMFPDPVAMRADTQANHEQERSHKEYEDDYKVVRETAKPFIGGGRGAAIVNQLGTSIMSLQRAEDILDKVDKGILVDAPAIVHALGTDYTRILTGGAGSEADREVFMPNDLNQKSQTFLKTMESEPKSILSPAFRQQMRETFNTLRETLYNQYDTKSGASASLLAPIFENPTYGKKLEKVFWSSVGSQGGSVSGAPKTVIQPPPMDGAKAY